MSAAPSPGFRVSHAPLFDPAPYARELKVYVAAILALLRAPEEPEPEAEALRAFHAEFIDCPCGPTSSPLSVTAEEGTWLFGLSLHGIFKHLGSGAVCCLLKTEPGVIRFGAPASADLRRVRSSWDSVNFLSPEIVDAGPATQPPAWLHRDARLGANGDDCWQGLFNISPHAQNGPEGDACFVCIPGSQEDVWTEEELVAAAGPNKAEQARKTDWVRAADFSDVLTRSRPIERIAVCGGGGVGWDSRLLHCGTLFATPGRPHPRMVKYIYYFRADNCPAAARKGHELMAKACTPGEEPAAFGSAATTTIAADQTSAPLALLPIAPTTPHRGNAKNSTGHLPTFRVAGKKRAQVDKLNRLVAHPLVRPFFTLPHAIARGLRLKHGGEGSLVGLALAVMARIRHGEGGEESMTPPMIQDLDTLRSLHAPPEPTSRKRSRA
jgi:hypothetical protein